MKRTSLYIGQFPEGKRLKRSSCERFVVWLQKDSPENFALLVFHKRDSAEDF
jgi:hypothetical protein